MRIAVVPGDGIGVDVTREAMKVLAAVARARSLAFEPVDYPWGADHYLATGETVPPGAFDDLAANSDAIFMGAFGDPRVPDMRHAAEILLGARFHLDLYVNYRPVRCLDDRLCPLKGFTAADVDFVVFRENTEGIYVGAGGNLKKGTDDEVAVQEDVSTRKGVERIVRYAFEYARTRGRKRVVMSDKSNAMRHVGDLWQRVFWAVAREYPDVESSHLYIDALCMQMIKDPRQFDVVVTNNMFGDISMFEPVHGSAPKYAGTGRANPFGAILTAGLMLDHLGHRSEAEAIERAVARCVRERQGTKDVGGTLTTSAAGDAVCERLEFEAATA